jgi:hypothetical protein
MEFLTRPGKLRRVVLAALSALLAAGQLNSAAQEISREYQIKAAFLFNFAQFVEWPAGAFPLASTPLCIGILGTDPFGAALDDTVQGETIRNHPLVVTRSSQVEDLKDCQLVFVSESERDRVGEVLAALDPQSVLTVSDIERFAERGGVIRFFVQGNRVRFEINPASARREGIKISSQLLALGRIVESDPTAGGR